MKSKVASVDDLRSARKIINRTQDLESFVFFPALDEIKIWSLYVYADAFHANLPDGVSSAMGCLIFVVGRGVPHVQSVGEITRPGTWYDPCWQQRLWLCRRD